MPEFPSDEIVTERFNLLRDIALTLVGDGVISNSILVRTNRIKLATEGYFLLNHAYKKWRINDGHRTEPPKIAALTCMSLAVFQPMLPIDPSNAETVLEARCNEIYSLACAATFLGIPFKPNESNFYLRVLDVLSETDCDTLEVYRVDKDMQNNRVLGSYDLSVLDRDKQSMNSLISLFEALAGAPKLVQ